MPGSDTDGRRRPLSCNTVNRRSGFRKNLHPVVMHAELVHHTDGATVTRFTDV